MKMLKTDSHSAEVILDSINDGVVTISLDKKIKYLNRAAERLLGYTLDEALDLPCDTVVHCEACEGDCLLEKAISIGGNISDYPTVIRNRSGECISVRSNTALLKNESGQVIGGVEIIKDLSQIEALTEQLRGKYSFENIIGKNHQMQEIYALLPAIANLQSPVLILGAPGTGKELVAQAIHQNSSRRDKPFIKAHCGAMTEGLLESELFGHVKGAFAGALSDKIGKLEFADGGTVMLEEIGRAPMSFQTKILKLFDEGFVERVGNRKKGKRVNVRIVGTTSQNLEESVKQGDFNGELYQRLAAGRISLPLLRERRDDIPLLVDHFLDRMNRDMGKEIESVSSEAMEVLLNYDYPGNIEELERIMAHAVALCVGRTILPSLLPRNLLRLNEDFMEYAMQSEDPLGTIEKQLLLRILSQTGWNFKETAERLKVSRTTLWRKIKSLKIERL